MELISTIFAPQIFFEPISSFTVIEAP